MGLNTSLMLGMPKFFRNFPDSNFIDTHAEFISIFPDNRPDIDFLCYSADDIAFAYYHGTTAYSTYHRYGIGGCSCWKIWTEYPWS